METLRCYKPQSYPDQHLKNLSAFHGKKAQAWESEAHALCPSSAAHGNASPFCLVNPVRPIAHQPHPFPYWAMLISPIHPCPPLLVDQKWQIEKNGWHHSRRNYGEEKRGEAGRRGSPGLDGWQPLGAPSICLIKIRRRCLAT